MIPLKQQRKRSSFAFNQTILQNEDRPKGVLKKKGITSSTLFPGSGVSMWQHTSLENDRLNGNNANRDLSNIVDSVIDMTSERNNNTPKMTRLATHPTSTVIITADYDDEVLPERFDKTHGQSTFPKIVKSSLGSV